MTWLKKSLPPIPGGNSPKGGGKKSLPPSKGKGGGPKKTLPPKKNPLPVIRLSALTAVGVGTIFAAAGIVSLQAHNPGRGFSVLLALALLYGGGRYATSLLTRGRRVA